MGAGKIVAGVSSYDHYPPEVEKLPKLGGLLDPNVEQLLAIKPDLVIVYGTQTDLVQQLKRAGIPMFPYVHRDLTDVTHTIRDLGRAVGYGFNADAVADAIQTKLKEVRAKVSGRNRPRTLVVFGRQPGTLQNIDASGGYGFLHDMLGIAGGEDVMSDVKRESVQMSTEMVLARAPEVIIELHYGASLSAIDEEREKRVWDKLGSVPAVRDHRVFLVIGDEYVVPGPRIAAATEHLAQILHPGAFK
jgi:iron complex transport system substrate-binding protein